MAQATQEKIVEGDLLYHAVHGLCRVDRVLKPQSPAEGLSYSLLPKVMNKMKSRFIIPASDLEASGFHNVISVKDANRILDYLKAGDPDAIPSEAMPRALTAFAQPNETWGLAQMILTFSREKLEAKDQRKRQMLERSTKGLVGELSCVYKISPKETVARIQKSLGSPSKINPSVLAALTNAGEE